MGLKETFIRKIAPVNVIKKKYQSILHTKRGYCIDHNLGPLGEGCHICMTYLSLSNV